MKLTDLYASFIIEKKSSNGEFVRVNSINGAQGIIFQCPKCAIGKKSSEENGKRGFVGVHYVICWFELPHNAPKVPDWLDPKPGRWFFTGNSLETLTFTGPGLHSILLVGGCGWHGMIDNGTILNIGEK
jgi:hypothetical protein